MSSLVADAIFAPIDADLHLERIAGGNETEVYRTDDQRFVVKVKSEAAQSPHESLAEAQAFRQAAEAFSRAVGPEHSVPNYYLISGSSAGRVQALVLQPFLQQAQPLFEVDYGRLSAAERQQIAAQLREIIRRSLKFYRETGQMPDLYGRTSASQAERKRLNTLVMLPWRLWSFIFKRNLLRSHNLMLTAAPERRIVLVDYDPVRRSQLYRFIYYTVRRVLFLRDKILIRLMEKSGYVAGK